jgi:hypothetical protein
MTSLNFPARRDKVLDEVSAAIPGDASRREHLSSAARGLLRVCISFPELRRSLDSLQY